MEKSQNNGFERYDLDARVIEALPKIGYHTPTPVQHKVIPLILQRRNLLVEAATGTGKTAAYGLPLLSRIDPLKKNVQALVLVPSRELALQVESALKTFSANPKVRIASLVGGASLEAGEKIVHSAPHILVAVPGRLKDVLISGKYDTFWKDIKYLILDEADKMLELGFQNSVDNLVSNLRNTIQVALFSATISEDVESMVRERFAPLMTVRLSPREALKKIRFYNVVIENGHHAPILAGLLKERKINQALIFCHKREEVSTISNFLRALGMRAEAYHGHLDQVEREAIMKRFKGGAVDYLVATDLAARGLDVEDLPAVINFDFPDDREVYLHRCGRTGRAGKKGEVYNFIRNGADRIFAQKFHDEWVLRLDLVEAKPIFTKTEDEVKWVKVHLNKGKKDKIRTGDVAGFIAHEGRVPLAEIGTIALYESYTLVDLPEDLFRFLASEEGLKIKGKTVKITRFTLADMQRKAQAVKKSQLGVRDKAKLERIREGRTQTKPEKAESQISKSESKKEPKGKGPEKNSKSKPGSSRKGPLEKRVNGSKPSQKPTKRR